MLIDSKPSIVGKYFMLNEDIAAGKLCFELNLTIQFK